MSTLCYMLARFVSGILDFGLAVINSVDIKQFHGAEVGLASLVTTYILMQPLQGAYRAYSKKQIWCISFTGGIVSSLLMLCIPGAPLLSLSGNLIFFTGWQSIMLTVIGLPILQMQESYEE